MRHACSERAPLVVAEATAREAGALLRDAFGARHEITDKGAIDLVTEMDNTLEMISAAWR